MNRLVFFAILVIAVYFLWRRFIGGSRPGSSVKPDPKIARRQSETLEPDPKTGVYRPVRRDE